MSADVAGPDGSVLSEGLGPWTCRDAKQLRKHLAMNCRALLKTAPLVVEGVEDDDAEFALREIGHAESQLRGLRQMLEQAKVRRCSLVGDGDGT